MRFRLFVIAMTVATITGRAGANDRPPCLGAEVGRVLSKLAAAHAVEASAPPGYRLDRLDVQPDHIELGYVDERGPAVTVSLYVSAAQTERRPGDAQGPHFDHHVEDFRGDLGASARKAMLDAAMTVDRAVPAGEIRSCARGSTGTSELRAPAAFGLAMGLLQVATVLAALALGIGARRGTTDRRAPAVQDRARR